MKPHLAIYSISLTCSLVFGSYRSFASALDELSLENQNRVKNGEQVAIYTPTAESVWPKCAVYQRVEATPEQAAAIFFDFDLQATYIHNLTSSHISKVVDKNVFDVDYSLSLPMGLGHESYSIENRIRSYDSGSSFRLDWKLIWADSTKKSEGTARFEPLENGTLFSYYSYIVPGRLGAGMGWVVDRAKETVKQNVTQITHQIEIERVENPNLLTHQIEWLRSIL